MKQIASVHGLRLMWLLPLLAVQLLSACGSKSRLDGTYTAADPLGFTKVSLTFKSNGKITISSNGMETEGVYTVDGNKIKLTNPQVPGVTQVMTLLDDGSIEADMGVKFAKQKK